MEDKNRQMSNGQMHDIVRLSIAELVRDTTIPADKIAEFISVLEKYNVSTFLIDSAIPSVISELIKGDGNQDVLFDLMVEFRYKLLTHGFTDGNIRYFVDASLSVITTSSIIPHDYKSSIAAISNEKKNDVFLCLLYLLRVNLLYVAERLSLKINKEKNNG